MKQIVLILLLTLFISCRRDPVPRDAIQRDRYVAVLVDVHIAEGLVMDQKRLNIDSLESSSLYLSVLEKHGVTSEDMLTTALYYSRHQREYKKIYTDVLDRISILMEEENAREELLIQTDTLKVPSLDLKVK
ncbi:MAG: DUF4296 domain-containing protein [Prolixibacteraceae bacterium]|nr:DUF4296 domain-containing protein [Prolixibacteraceae bacterium]